jgi:hypothetical protein
VRQLEALLPPALLAALTQAGGAEAAFVSDSLDAPVDTPELVWTPEMRARTAAAVCAAAAAAAATMRGGASLPRWRAADNLSPVVHPELEFDLYVGGVYLKRFLDTSKASSNQELRDPRAFLDGLFADLGGALDAAAAAAQGAQSTTLSEQQ